MDSDVIARQFKDLLILGGVGDLISCKYYEESNLASIALFVATTQRKLWMQAIQQLLIDDLSACGKEYQLVRGEVRFFWTIGFRIEHWEQIQTVLKDIFIPKPIEVPKENMVMVPPRHVDVDGNPWVDTTIAKAHKKDGSKKSRISEITG